MVRYRGTSTSDFRTNGAAEGFFLLATLKQVMQKFTLTQITDMVKIFNDSVKDEYADEGYAMVSI